MQLQTALILLDAETFHLFVERSEENLRDALMDFYLGWAEDNGHPAIPDNSPILIVTEAIEAALPLKIQFGTANV